MREGRGGGGEKSVRLRMYTDEGTGCGESDRVLEGESEINDGGAGA